LSENTKKEISFDKNSNQFGASQSYFFVKDNNIQVSFDKSGITFKLYNSSFSEAGGNSLQPQTLKLKFLNSSNTEILALDKADFYTNYYNDFVPQGATHIPNYKKLVYKNLYNGIDAVFTLENHALKYEFVVSKGANPNEIQYVWIDKYDNIVDVNKPEFVNRIVTTAELAPETIVALFTVH